ncbi:hypothetical protein D3C80_1935880 [compost metagenome]
MELFSTLPINVEQHVLTVCQRFLSGLAQRAIEVAMHLCPFDQLIIVTQPLKFTLGDEVVMHAIDFAWAALTRGNGDR